MIAPLDASTALRQTKHRLQHPERRLKYLLLVIGLIVVYWLFKAYKIRTRRGPRDPAARAGEDMVRCAQCGVHLPRSESLPSGQVFYCSAEHRRLRETAP